LSRTAALNNEGREKIDERRRHFIYKGYSSWAN
jgi:hypothetical protein